MENTEIKLDISNNTNVEKRNKKYSNIIKQIKKNKENRKLEKKLEPCISQKIEKI
tara:strand:- start:952 stop:1116 length:165 start_codon:yes stop_codon:yes gene_type:complete